MSTDTNIPPPPPEAPPAPDVDPVMKFGQELKKAPGFSASLDKAQSDRQSKEAGSPVLDKKGGDAKPDPIAANNDKDKKDTPPAPTKDSKPSLGKRSSRLLEEPTPAGDDPAAKPEDKDKKDKPDVKDNEGDPVTDKDLEEELHDPHKSAKANKRFRELYRRMKEAEGKHATTDKQLKEKEAKLLELQQQLDAAAKKTTTPDPDTLKKLEEFDMLRRQHDLENDPKVKELYDSRITQSEDAISSVLESNNITFKNMDVKTSLELIKKEGGFYAFAQKYPQVAQDIIDSLNVADAQQVQASISRQIMWKDEKKTFIQAEKAKAKEYFEKQAKDREEQDKNAPTPERLKEAHKAKLESVKKQIMETADIFKDQEIPADASEEEKTRLTAENEFTAELRETLASHLDPQNDDEFVDTAVAATLAHKFKREKTALAAENAALKKEIERIKNAGRTTPRGGAIPPTVPPKDFAKPAPSFGAALDLVQRNRG